MKNLNFSPVFREFSREEQEKKLNWENWNWKIKSIKKQEKKYFKRKMKMKKTLTHSMDSYSNFKFYANWRFFKKKNFFHFASRENNRKLYDYELPFSFIIIIILTAEKLHQWRRRKLFSFSLIKRHQQQRRWRMKMNWKLWRKKKGFWQLKNT